MFSPVLYILVFVIAIVYSSAGFGGASGYLLAMSFFDIPIYVMSSTALVLNMVVATISFVNYVHSGHFRSRLLFPFLLASVPAAFVGGYIQISQEIYMMLLYGVLTYLAVRMILFPTLSGTKDWQPRSLPLWLALLSGAIIGLLSGMVGIGGGILLSPLIILARWGTSKEAATSAAGFIALNSMSGLTARLVKGTLMVEPFSIWLVMIGIAGAVIGGQVGAIRLSNAGVRRVLGIILAIAVGAYWLQ